MTRSAMQRNSYLLQSSATKNGGMLAVFESDPSHSERQLLSQSEDNTMDQLKLIDSKPGQGDSEMWFDEAFLRKY